MYCLQKAHFRFRDTYRPKVKGWKKKYSMKLEIKVNWSGSSHFRQH